MRKQRVDYEKRFYWALKEITRYMTTGQLRRESEKRYGVSYEEGLEMAYENVLGTAKHALKGYKRPRAGTEQPLGPAKATSVGAASQGIPSNSLTDQE